MVETRSMKRNNNELSLPNNVTLRKKRKMNSACTHNKDSLTPIQLELEDVEQSSSSSLVLLTVDTPIESCNDQPPLKQQQQQKRNYINTTNSSFLLSRSVSAFEAISPSFDISLDTEETNTSASAATDLASSDETASISITSSPSSFHDVIGTPEKNLQGGNTLTTATAPTIHNTNANIRGQEILSSLKEVPVNKIVVNKENNDESYNSSSYSNSMMKSSTFQTKQADTTTTTTKTTCDNNNQVQKKAEEHNSTSFETKKKRKSKSKVANIPSFFHVTSRSTIKSSTCKKSSTTREIKSSTKKSSSSTSSSYHNKIRVSSSEDTDCVEMELVNENLTHMSLDSSSILPHPEGDASPASNNANNALLLNQSSCTVQSSETHNTHDQDSQHTNNEHNISSLSHQNTHNTSMNSTTSRFLIKPHLSLTPRNNCSFQLQTRGVGRDSSMMSEGTIFTTTGDQQHSVSSTNFIHRAPRQSNEHDAIATGDLLFHCHGISPLQNHPMEEVDEERILLQEIDNHQNTNKEEEGEEEDAATRKNRFASYRHVRKLSTSSYGSVGENNISNNSNNNKMSFMLPMITSQQVGEGVGGHQQLLPTARNSTTMKNTHPSNHIPLHSRMPTTSLSCPPAVTKLDNTNTTRKKKPETPESRRSLLYDDDESQSYYTPPQNINDHKSLFFPDMDSSATASSSSCLDNKENINNVNIPTHTHNDLKESSTEQKKSPTRKNQSVIMRSDDTTQHNEINVLRPNRDRTSLSTFESSESQEQAEENDGDESQSYYTPPQDINDQSYLSRMGSAARRTSFRNRSNTTNNTNISTTATNSQGSSSTDSKSLMGSSLLEYSTSTMNVTDEPEREADGNDTTSNVTTTNDNGIDIESESDSDTNDSYYDSDDSSVTVARLPPPSILKTPSYSNLDTTITSTTKTRKTTKIRFGAASVAEFDFEQPSKIYTPLPKEVSQELYKLDIPEQTLEEEEQNEEMKQITMTNNSVLETWEDDFDLFLEESDDGEKGCDVSSSKRMSMQQHQQSNKRRKSVSYLGSKQPKKKDHWSRIRRTIFSHHGGSLLSPLTPDDESSKFRKLRPMPDMSAFEGGSSGTNSSFRRSSFGVSNTNTGGGANISRESGSNYNNSSFSYGGTSSHHHQQSPFKVACPPTPIRTPAWVHNDTLHCFTPSFNRSYHNSSANSISFNNCNSVSKQDSLISTKILAACPPELLDGFSSFENSLGDDNYHPTNNNEQAAVSNSLTLEGNTTTGGTSTSSPAHGVFPRLPAFPPHRQHQTSFTSGVSVNESINSGTSQQQQRTATASGSSSFLKREPLFTPPTPPYRSSSMVKRPYPNNNNSNKTQTLRDSSISYSEIGSIISFDTDFENLGQIGSGHFADVFKVRLKKQGVGVQDSNSKGCLYAIKRNRRQFRGKRDREQALTEVRNMQRLQLAVKSRTTTTTKHQNEEERSTSNTNTFCPYLLLFIRAWQEDGHFFSQTELCCRDNCRNMILSLRSEWPIASKKYPSLLRNLPPISSSSSMENDEDDCCRLLPESTIWRICHDIVSGLAHIHSHNMVHNDIKPSNIFFAAHNRIGCICKIGDFGLACDSGSTEDGHEGDTKYMPQELLSSNARLMPSADIFSFGLTLYELSANDTFELPAEGPRWHDIRSGKHKPEIPNQRCDELKNIVQNMINPDPSKRCSARDILDLQKVKEAGNSFEKFLAEYVHDVAVNDLEIERELAAAQKEAALGRYTPTSRTVGISL